MSTYENELCKVKTGEIHLGDDAAKQCLEGAVNRFMDGEIDIQGFLDAGTPVTESESPSIHNACAACDACSRTLNVASTSDGGRLAISTIPKDVLPLANDVIER